MGGDLFGSNTCSNNDNGYISVLKHLVWYITDINRLSAKFIMTTHLHYVNFIV